MHFGALGISGGPRCRSGSLYGANAELDKGYARLVDPLTRRAPGSGQSILQQPRECADVYLQVGRFVLGIEPLGRAFTSPQEIMVVHASGYGCRPEAGVHPAGREE